jgi:hypothetical protein
VKKTILKAWPEMEEFAPLLTSPSKTSTLTSSLYIDFSGCDSIDSCGLTAFLFKIIQYFERVKNTDLTWEVNSSEKARINQNIKQLGFFKPILHLYQKSLFSKSNEFLADEESIKTIMFGGEKISFPIIYIDFTTGDKRRDSIKQVNKILYERLFKFSETYDFNVVQLISILFEMSKNSADHTEKNALLGMDISESNDTMKLSFLYGDFGSGINQHVGEYLRKNNKNRLTHLSAAEIYYIACSKEFTTKPNSGINSGLGMSHIIEFAITMNVKLSVFDASSRGMLSKIDIITQKASYISHRAMRDNFYIFSHNNPFCYFGSMEAKKK